MKPRYKIYTHRLLNPDGSPHTSAVDELRRLSETWRIQLVSRDGFEDAKATALRLGIDEIIDWSW